MARLRMGIVGAGNIASIAQLPSLVDRDDVELTALVSRREDPSGLVRRWGFKAVHGSVEEMLERESLDAVFVLTPRSEHAATVETCLRFGVDVFCEKPLATSTADAERLADLADSLDRVVMVGLNRRYAPAYVAGREVFGESGAQQCIAQKNRAGSEYRATFENAIHMVDLLRWYCGGEPVSVAAHACGNDEWEEDGASALVQFDNGNVGVLVAARTAGAWEENLDAYGGGASVHVQAPERLSVSRNGNTTTRDLSSEAFGWASATSTLGFRASVDHFIDCIREHRVPETSAREAAGTQALLDRILAAAGLPTQEQEGRQWTSHATR
ncbi:MAG: Gfo/Idh/MocA family protein [Nostocoides sp.]